MTKDQAYYGFKNSAWYVITQILFNNAEAVHNKLLRDYHLGGGIGTPEDEFQPIKDRISQVLSEQSTLSAKREVLVDIMGVPIIQSKLDQNQREALYRDVFVKGVVPQYRDEVIPLEDLGLEDVDEDYDSEYVPDIVIEENGDQSGFNWGGVLTGVLNGALDYFLPNNNTATTPNTNVGGGNQGSNKTNWALIAIVSVLIIVAIWFGYSALKKKA